MSSFVALLPSFVQYGYAALFVFMLLGATYLPVPSNLALVAAGALARFSQDGIHFNIFLAAIIGFVAASLGDIAAYYIARHFGHGDRRVKFEKKHPHFRRISTYLKSHPILTVSLSRILGFLSPLVNTVAGFSKMHSALFISSDLLGNVLYIVLFMGAGYLIGDTDNPLFTMLGIGIAVTIVLVSLYIGFMILNQKED